MFGDLYKLNRSKVNDLLLADASRARPASARADIYMLGLEEAEQIPEETEAFEVMDLATFLECVSDCRACHAYISHVILLTRFAIQSTHCLEMIHKSVFLLDIELKIGWLMLNFFFTAESASHTEKVYA
jgi:hypothetical protein